MSNLIQVRCKKCKRLLVAVNGNYEIKCRCGLFSTGDTVNKTREDFHLEGNKKIEYKA